MLRLSTFLQSAHLIFHEFGVITVNFTSFFINTKMRNLKIIWSTAQIVKFYRVFQQEVCIPFDDIFKSSWIQFFISSNVGLDIRWCSFPCTRNGIQTRKSTWVTRLHILQKIRSDQSILYLNFVTQYFNGMEIFMKIK